ncbi:MULTISPECIES: hypothetical protein [unclassified Burkholderia]|uniref:hypothetical protein n=1 Tax=unclassified Burkholderia TaxID=2613784 RepID=UPI0012E3F63C|nr:MULTISPECIES: hypothetical protein [unclassified Burkholderia]
MRHHDFADECPPCPQTVQHVETALIDSREATGGATALDQWGTLLPRPEAGGANLHLRAGKRRGVALSEHGQLGGCKERSAGRP